MSSLIIVAGIECQFEESCSRLSRENGVRVMTLAVMFRKQLEQKEAKWIEFRSELRSWRILHRLAAGLAPQAYSGSTLGQFEDGAKQFQNAIF